jgi:Domain of unknown function (DUF4429)/Short C-terminal domain/Bacterial PH domain
VEAKGIGGRVTLDDDAVTFVFKGLIVSRAKTAASPRRIPLAAVRVAEFREPFGLSPGYLRVWEANPPPAYHVPDPGLDANCLEQGDTEALRKVAAEINRRIGAPPVVVMPHGHTVRTDLIDAMVRAGQTVGAGAEIAALPELLTRDERVVELAAGRYRGRRSVVVVTDRRMIFYDEGRSVEDHRLLTITDVHVGQDLGSAELAIQARGQEVRIKGLLAERAVAVADAIHAAQAGLADDPGDTDPEPAVPPVTADAAPHVLDLIRKLAELRDLGVLTAEEFAAKKADLLRRL